MSRVYTASVSCVRCNATESWDFPNPLDEIRTWWPMGWQAISFRPKPGDVYSEIVDLCPTCSRAVRDVAVTRVD